MAKKQTDRTITFRDIEKLLNEQTTEILSAVDHRIGISEKRIDERIGILETKIVSLEKRIAKLEIKVEKRFDQLATALDKFLKRLTDAEDEFAIMKLDINRLKKVVKEKLGVDL